MEKKATQLYDKVGELIDTGIKEVKSAVSSALARTPNAKLDLPINVGPSDLVDSPWGKAKQLLSKEKETKNGAGTAKIEVYCVECGIKGTFHLQGRARYTITEGLTEANAGMNGNLAAGLQVGIDAKVEYNDKFRYNIVSAAIPPGFSVPGIFAVGLVVTLDAELALGVDLAGQVLAGVKMSIPSFQANLDLVDSKKSTSGGFTPKFEKIFEAKAAISASAALGLPLGIGVGVVIPPLKFQKTAAIYDTPSIGATIKYSGSTTNQGINDDNTCLNGISYSLQCKVTLLSISECG